jgi:hypothetical protein
LCQRSNSNIERKDLAMGSYNSGGNMARVQGEFVDGTTSCIGPAALQSGLVAVASGFKRTNPSSPPKSAS